MIDPLAFQTWLDQAITDAPRTAGDIPLIGFDQLNLKDAQAVPLINALADIILSTCVQAAAVPTTHATAA